MKKYKMKGEEMSLNEILERLNKITYEWADYDFDDQMIKAEIRTRLTVCTDELYNKIKEIQTISGRFR